MVILAGITACIWFCVGISIGWGRGRRAYLAELKKKPDLIGAEAKRADHKAGVRGLTVWYAWTVAGLLGAFIWFGLCMFLYLSSVAAEEESKSPSRGRYRGGGWVWALLGLGGLALSSKLKRAVEQDVDGLLISLSIPVTIAFAALVYLVAAH